MKLHSESICIVDAVAPKMWDGGFGFVKSERWGYNL